MSDLSLVNRGLAVGIPLSGKPTVPEWGISLAVQGWPINTAVNWLTIKGKEVAQARTDIVKETLKHGVRYLWFIDEDVAVPHFAISKLMYVLRNRQMEDPKVMIVGGIYCTKTDPIAYPIVFKGNNTGPHWEWSIGDVFECDGIGAGCMLIDTEIFKELEEPWFKTVDEVYDDMAIFLPGAAPAILKNQGNEDSYFCLKVRQTGFKILAHGGVLCPHWNARTGVAYVLPMDSYPVTSVKKEIRDLAEATYSELLPDEKAEEMISQGA